MKQVFKMKTMLLALLLCAAGFGAKAQIARATNTSLCSVMVRFYAVDAVTCAIVATDPGPYFIPAGTVPPGINIPAVWIPAPPVAPYFIVAEVTDVVCGFPGVLVGNPIAPCGYVPFAPLPACLGSCPGSTANNPGPVFPPGSGGVFYPLIVR